MRQIFYFIYVLYFYIFCLQVATKKKSVADEVGIVLQAKLRQLAPAQ